MLDLFAMTLLVVLVNHPKFHTDIHVENLPVVEKSDEASEAPNVELNNVVIKLDGMILLNGEPVEIENLASSVKAGVPTIISLEVERGDAADSFARTQVCLKGFAPKLVLTSVNKNESN